MDVASGEIQRRPGHATEGASPWSEAAAILRDGGADKRVRDLREANERSGKSQTQEGKVVSRGKDDLRRARR
jgi:hypothetical protein